MSVQAEVIINLSGLKKFAGRIKAGDELSRAITTRWAARYRGFILKRFDTFSKGGGNWPPLAPATVARRRKGDGSASPTILRDKGLLFAALNPGLNAAPGSLTEHGKWFVVVGYGGASRYPDSSATIADIASFHNTGGGRLPQRKIIVPPSSELQASMIKDATDVLSRECKKNVEGS